MDSATFAHLFIGAFIASLAIGFIAAYISDNL